MAAQSTAPGASWRSSSSATSTLLTPTDAPMIWHGWGDPRRRTGLSPRAEALLASQIGSLTRHTPPVPLEDVRVAESTLTDGQRRRLAAAVGEEWVKQDHRTRVEHAGGKSYPDLLRRRQGDAVGAPDAVVFPGSHREVEQVLAAAVEEGIAVVPFGGGTSVVGGVEPERGPFSTLVAVDLRRMQRLLDLDEESLLATFEPGLRGPQAESELRRRGYSLGHFPQSYAYATIGGYVATRSAGQSSTGFGRIDEKVVAVRMATPRGDLRLGHAPHSAAGPDLRHLVVGSEGLFGIITAATLRIHRAPEVEVHEGWASRTFAEGLDALRELVQSDAAPDICRLSDADETRVYLGQTEGIKGRIARGWLRLRGHADGCLLIVGWEGPRPAVAARRAAAQRILTNAGLLRLGSRPGAAWAHSRFDGPYLRDDLMDRGVLVETLETATTWSRIGTLYVAVREALREALTDRGTPPLVMCHVSHLYPVGASLYYTWLARQEPGHELAQWHAAKSAAGDAIVAAGGTITHHHAVGTDHRAWMPQEVGPLGIEVLRAVKAQLDPTGIMNPGKLLPPDG